MNDYKYVAGLSIHFVYTTRCADSGVNCLRKPLNNGAIPFNHNLGTNNNNMWPHLCIPVLGSCNGG